MILIIAPNHEVFRHYVRQTIRYVSSPDQLRGVDALNTQIILSPDWFKGKSIRDRDEFSILLKVLIDRGSKVTWLED